MRLSRKRKMANGMLVLAMLLTVLALGVWQYRRLSGVLVVLGLLLNVLGLLLLLQDIEKDVTERVPEVAQPEPEHWSVRLVDQDNS